MQVPGGKDRANADDVNTTCEVQTPAHRGGEDFPHSKSVLAERKLPSSSEPTSSMRRSASGMGRVQSNNGQYQEHMEVEYTNLKKPPPTAELVPTTCTLGSGPMVPLLSNLLSATISESLSLPVISYLFRQLRQVMNNDLSLLN